MVLQGIIQMANNLKHFLIQPLDKCSQLKRYPKNGKFLTFEIPKIVTDYKNFVCKLKYWKCHWLLKKKYVFTTNFTKFEPGNKIT